MAFYIKDICLSVGKKNLARFSAYLICNYVADFMSSEVCQAIQIVPNW